MKEATPTATRWWRFTTLDLLWITLIAAVGIATILFLARRFDVPVWVSVSSAWVIPCLVIGMLARQFRGGVMGAILGGLLAFISMIAYTIVAK